MIDIHCHILPGTDDGAQTLEEAVEMARIAWKDGITDIIAAPHTHDGIFLQQPESVLAAVKAFQDVLQKKGILLRIHPGSEVHIHGELIDNLFSFQILSLGNRMKHMLLELPSLHLPLFTEELLRQLISHGITPIIAHPERNEVLRRKPTILGEWITQGVISQITAGSLLGLMGSTAKKSSHDLVKRRMAHVIASDGHNHTNRRAELSKAYELLARLLPAEEVETYRFNAEAILKGETCRTFALLSTNSQKRWFFF